MTLTGKIMFGLHGLVLLGTARAGTLAATLDRWDLALTLYAIAAITLAALVREISRADLHETGRPAWVTRLRARRAARRLTRVEQCSCETWWETFGEAHDATCPKGAPRRSDYLAEAGDDE
jgi:hypothetical protein